MSTATILDLIEDGIVVPVVEVEEEEIGLYRDILMTSTEREYLRHLKRLTDFYGSPGDTPMCLLPHSANQFRKTYFSEPDTRDFCLRLLDPSILQVQKTSKLKAQEDKLDSRVENLRNTLLDSFGRKYFYPIDDFVEDFRISCLRKCAVIDEFADYRFFRRISLLLEKEIKRQPTLSKVIQESLKARCFYSLLEEDCLRLPWSVSYDDIKKFRKDKAHSNLSRWLAETLQSPEPPDFYRHQLPSYVKKEFNELSNSIQRDTSRKSQVCSLALSGLTAYLALVFTGPALAIISSVSSYVPFSYALSQFFARRDPHNFVAYFARWRRPPISTKKAHNVT